MAIRYLVIFFVLNICQNAIAFPTPKSPTQKVEHCIKMTPQKEKDINAIIKRLTEFVYDITDEFEYFDITLIKLDIENHSDDEVEEKEVKIQVSVNDCGKFADVDKNIVNKGVKSIGDKDALETVSRYNDGVITKTPVLLDQSRNELAPDIVKPKEFVDYPKDLANNKPFNNVIDNKISDPKYIESYNNNQQFKTVIDNQVLSAVQHQQPIITDNSGIANPDCPTTLDTAYELNNDRTIDTISNNAKPELILLELEKPGQDLIDSLNKGGNRNPLLVYIQRNKQSNEDFNRESNNEDCNHDPELMFLDLEKPGQDLINALDKGRKRNPFLLYVQKHKGYNEYYFP